jgi:hypothetical protein
VVGTLPTELALLTNLRDFELEGFNVLGTLEGKFASPKLERLTLNRTGLSGTLPSELFLNNPNLRSLHLGYSQMEGTLPDSLWSMTALENVTLLSNSFSGPLERHLNLNESTTLTAAIRTCTLRLRTEQLCRLFTAFFVPCRTIGDILQSALGSAAGYDWLAKLAGDTFPAPESNCWLCRCFTGISDQTKYVRTNIDSNLAACARPNLLLLFCHASPASLDLQENRLSAVSESIFSLSGIETLRLNHNPIAGTLSSLIANLRSLKELRIGSSFISGPLPSELYRLPISVLDVSYANVSGPLPGALLSALNDTATELLLHGNAFRGTIPTELGGLLRLKYLLLFGNQFNGTVPTQLCTLRQTGRLMVDLRVSCDVECACCNPCVSENGNSIYNLDDL